MSYDPTSVVEVIRDEAGRLMARLDELVALMKKVEENTRGGKKDK